MQTKTQRNLAKWAAHVIMRALTLVLFLCANTNSCTLLYQEEVPAEIERFRRIK